MKAHTADTLSGLAAGVAQVAVGHPFDTVKVRMQAAGGQYAAGPLACVAATVRNEGAAALYAGVGPPLAGAGLCTALLFGVHGRMRAAVAHSGIVRSQDAQAVLAGAATGLAMAPVLCPFELVKIRLQIAGTHGRGHGVTLVSTLRAATVVGGRRSLAPLFRGLLVTAARDVPSFAAYFGAYDALRRLSDRPSAAHLVLSGGLAGIAAWLPAYPQDVIKSVIQASPHPISATSALRAVLRDGGPRALFRGFSPVLLRAFPANAATFLAYEAMRSLISDGPVDIGPL